MVNVPFIVSFTTVTLLILQQHLVKINEEKVKIVYTNE